MKYNKKGLIMGWEYIVAFFMLVLVFGFVVGLYSLLLEEVYNPTHVVLNDSLVDLNFTSSIAYTEFEDNYDEVNSKTLPFNLLLMFLFIYGVIFSLINVAKQPKQDVFSLIFTTIGGMIFLIYILSVFIIEIIEFMNEQFIYYLFEDIIIAQIPFYMTLFENVIMIALLWGGAMVISNWFLGGTEERR